MIFCFPQRLFVFALFTFSWAWVILNMMIAALYPNQFGASFEKQTRYCAWIPVQNVNRGALFSGDASRYIVHELLQHQQTSAFVPDSHYSPCIDTVEIVVAYCNSDLSWINRAIEEIPRNLKLKMTILSKCRKDNNITMLSLNGTASTRFQTIDIIPLTNVGGCDYAYVYYMNYIIDGNNRAGSSLHESSILLFVKDTIRDRAHFHFGNHHGYRSFGRMIEIASRGEFACGIYPSSSFSWYHETKKLNNFVLRDYIRVSDLKSRGSNTGKGRGKDGDDSFNVYSYRNLGDYHSRTLNYSFSQQYTPVCYGGSFAIPSKKLYDFAIKESTSGKGRDILQGIENSMMRNANSMIEEHFAERTWASLFSEPLTHYQMAQLKSWTKNAGKLSGLEGQIELKNGFQF